MPEPSKNRKFETEAPLATNYRQDTERALSKCDIDIFSHDIELSVPEEVNKVNL